jgi:hypothetical protein
MPICICEYNVKISSTVVTKILEVKFKVRKTLILWFSKINVIFNHSDLQIIVEKNESSMKIEETMSSIELSSRGKHQLPHFLAAFNSFC